MKASNKAWEDPRLHDLRNIVYLTWKKTIPLSPDPTDVQYEMCEAIQGVLQPLLGIKEDPSFYKNFPQLTVYDKEGNPSPTNYLIIEAGRGMGKSVILGAVVPWVLAIKPTINIMVASGVRKKVDEFSLTCKRLIIEMEMYQHLIPNTQAGQRWGAYVFDVAGAGLSQAPSVSAVTIMGSFTGSRADVIIADDIETPNTSMTQRAREELEERIKEFAAVLNPGGIIIFLGTPQTEESIYQKLLGSGYRRIIWPSRFPDAKWLEEYGNDLSPLIRKRLEEDPSLATGYGLDGSLGMSTNPAMFNEASLLDREAQYGRSGFTMQFMLDSTLSDKTKYPLKLSDLIVMDIDRDLAPEKPIHSTSPDCTMMDLENPGLKGDRFHRALRLCGEMLPFKGSVMAIDPAGDGPDELAYAVVKQLNGFLYLTECYGLQGGYQEENLVKLAKVAADNNVNAVIIEKNFGGGIFTQLFKPTLNKYHQCLIEEVTHSKQKELRIIDCLEPLMNQHRLVIDRKLILKDALNSPQNKQPRRLFHQLTRITRARRSLRHDDRLDVLSIACQYWVETASLDADKQISKRVIDDYHSIIKEMRSKPQAYRTSRPERERKEAIRNGTYSPKKRKLGQIFNWLR